jgi:hypothetical protein
MTHHVILASDMYDIILTMFGFAHDTFCCVHASQLFGALCLLLPLLLPLLLLLLLLLLQGVPAIL